MQPLGALSSTSLAQLRSQLVAGTGKDSLGEQITACERSQRTAHVLLGGVAVLDRENSFSERSERLDSLELAMWIGPKPLAENSGVGGPENPVRVMQHAAKTHGPLDKIIALGKSPLKALQGIGDEVHFSR